MLRLAVSVVLLVTAGLLTAPAVAAEAHCVNMPDSTLRLHDIKALVLDERRTSAEVLDQAGTDGTLDSRHTLMLTIIGLVSLFRIAHRNIPQPDGSFWDVAIDVNIGLGANRVLPSFAMPPTLDHVNWWGRLCKMEPRSEVALPGR